MEETQCNSKLNCFFFQKLSRIITSSSAERNCHSEYTHNEGHKEDCENISLELGLHDIYIVFNVNCYLLIYSANNCC